MRLFGLLAAIVCMMAWLRGQGTSADSPADPERILASLISTNRLGTASEYRQERPHRERVFFDPEGHVLVQLASSKEKPVRIGH